MDEGVYVPATAVLVKVTNVVDPYNLRIYEIEGYSEKRVRLERRLHQLVKTELKEYRDDFRPQIGDLVLIDNRSSFNIDLPAWCCRGVVGSKETVDSKYRVFLPDHGISLNFWMEELKIITHSSIPDRFLTSAVGINEVLPIALVNSVACVSDHWSEVAVKFTREIIGAATQTYFDHLTDDESGNKYGELYLILEDEIVALSKALVCNRFATFISDDLMEMIENPDTLASRSSDEISETTCSGCDSVEEYSRKRNEKDEGKSENDHRVPIKRDRSTAVYTRAFDRSLKKHRSSDHDHEILICSKIKCERLNSVEEARFPAKIHKVLPSLSLRRPWRLQKHVWPAITKGLNVVAVAAPKSGKTTSYLVPIVSMIAANETHTKVSGVNGPLALILCVSALDVHDINEKCTELLKNYPKVKVLPAYNGLSEISVTIQAYNGCEILISTPPYLKRLIRSNKKLLNFSRLAHMVFDGVDVMFEKYRDSLGEILKIPKAVENEHRNSPGTMPLQMIAIARHWTPSLRKLVNGFIEDPYVCIGSYMEAAVYAALKPTLLFLPKNQKPAKVIELLDDRWSMIKTIIICTSTKEVMELAEALKSNSIDTLIVNDEMISTEILGIKETWMTRVSGSYFVLVCTDQVLPDLNIKDAEWLIHYSLGSSTKTQFYYRFSTLSNNFSHLVHGKERPRPKCLLMADESNDAQLNGVVTVMQRLEVKIPPSMKAYLEEIFVTVEMGKTDRQLCENVKAFGRCPRRDSCPSRHCVVPEIDRPATDIKTGDWVKLVLTGRHSPNHYSARIIEYTRAGTNEHVPFSFQEFIELTLKMQKHYSNPASRRSSKELEIGHVCALEEAPGNYKRMQVLSVTDKDTSDIQFVQVRCIDDGDVFSVKACQLLEIPDDLAQWPSHIVDVYLTGIIPFDDEPTWSPCADEIVLKWFVENLTHPTSSVYGKVLFHLGHILWVDPLEIRHKLQQNYPDLVDSSLKARLIDAECAMENKEHIAHLQKYCRIESVA